MDNLFQDVRFGARVLIKNRGSSALSILALALGIGLCGMMFSIVWGAILRGLPFDRPEQILNISRTNLEDAESRMGVSIHDFEDYRAQQTAFTDIAGFYTGTVNVSGIERPERFDGAFITPQAFAIIGAQPFMGRVLTEEDARPGAEGAILLGYDTWRNRFGADTNILGRVVRANGRPATIVGVMEPGFGFPNSEEVWVPLALDASALPRNEGMWLSVFGRLRDGRTIDDAAVEMQGIASRLAAAYPETNEGIGATVRPYVKAFIGDEPVIMLYTMLGAVFMVLLIACANVTNLLISRAAARSREVGIRTAMGASGIRIVRQFLTESLILSIAGAVLGLVIAWIGVRLFSNAIAPTDPPFWIVVALDRGVLLFVLAITALSALISGAIPAWQAARANVSDVLKDESRGASSFRLGRISRALVVAEIALSAGLLVGAGLMIKSVTKVSSVEFAFAADDVFSARVGLPEIQYPDTAVQARFFDALLPRLRESSAIQSAGLISALPGTGSATESFHVEGATYAEDRDLPRTRTVMMSPGTLEALDVTLSTGRDFTEQDRRGAMAVAIVNQAFAQRFFAGDAVGRRIRLGPLDTERDWATIVGIVPDMYVGGLDNDEIPHAVYVPLAQAGARFMSVVARGRVSDPLELTQPVRDAVQAVDADLPIYFVQTLRQAIDSNNWFYRVFGTLFMVFGAVALFLASIGLYGVMSTSVSQRTREMGVRMALGAEGGDVLRLVMRQGLVQLAIGLVLGLAFALGLSNLLQMLLFEVNPRDPSIYAAIGLVLSATAASACLIPALRATRVHPMQSLRYD
ncbi:MAG TPA: ABC transporter permease [Longimicrobiales bacterium]|nr:ABC transporter permease [Longimicrobiales bacterium]